MTTDVSWQARHQASDWKLTLINTVLAVKGSFVCEIFWVSVTDKTELRNK